MSCDFLLFPPLKRAIHGVVRFATDAGVRTSVQKIFEEIPLEEFKKTLTVKWQEHTHQCTQQNEKNFEKVSAGDENIGDSD